MTESENENDHFDLDHFDHFFLWGGCGRGVTKRLGSRFATPASDFPKCVYARKKPPPHGAMRAE